MLRILIAIVLVVASAFGGFKAYLYYAVKGKVDETVQAMWMLGRITYGGIGTTLDGKISIEDIVIKPHDVEDEIKIGAFEIHTPGLGFLLNAEEQLSKGEFPQTMRFAVREARIDLNGGLMKVAQDAAAAHVDLQELCDFDGGYMFQLSGLGYQEWVGNALLGYEYDKERSRVRFFFEGEDIDIDKFAFETTVEIPPLAQLMMGQTGNVKVIHASFDYADTKFQTKLNEHCAKEAGIKVAEFVEKRAVAADKQFAELGISPGPGLRQAYRDTLNAGGRFVLTVDPLNPVDPTSLEFYEPRDLVKLLNVSLDVNGKRVDDLSFKFAEPQVVEEDDFSSEFLARLPSLKDYAAGFREEEPQDDDTPQVTQKPEIVAEFQHVRAKNLIKHVGQDVRIQTTDGHVRKGWLTSFKNNEAIVSWRVRGGQMSATVPLRKIDKAEVLVKKTL